MTGSEAIKVIGEVAFFCDGSLSAGLGHVNRCLAIAEALEELGYGSVFVGAFSRSSKSVVKEAGFLYEGISHGEVNLPLDQILEVFTKKSFAAVVIDSYAATASNISMIREKITSRLIVVDDTGELESYDCDGVINFSFLAESRGIVYKGTEAFVGPNYFPARRWLKEVRINRSTKSVPKNPSIGMIFAGGGDDGSLTCLLMGILAEFDFSMEVRIFLRPDAGKLEEVEKLLSERGLNGRILHGDSLFREALSESDLILCAGGLVKYESAFAGLPAAVLSATDIQREDTKSFESRGMCLSLDGMESVVSTTSFRDCNELLGDPGFRSSMIKNGLNFFPGDSSRRAALAVLGPN